MRACNRHLQDFQQSVHQQQLNGKYQQPKNKVFLAGLQQFDKADFKPDKSATRKRRK